MESNNQDEGLKEIFVNKKHFKVSVDSMNGEQILALAGFSPQQYDLFLIRGQKSEQIQPSQSIELENGMHFNAILKNAQYGNANDTTTVD